MKRLKERASTRGLIKKVSGFGLRTISNTSPAAARNAQQGTTHEAEIPSRIMPQIPEDAFTGSPAPTSPSTEQSSAVAALRDVQVKYNFVELVQEDLDTMKEVFIRTTGIGPVVQNAVRPSQITVESPLSALKSSRKARETTPLGDLLQQAISANIPGAFETTRPPTSLDTAAGKIKKMSQRGYHHDLEDKENCGCSELSRYQSSLVISTSQAQEPVLEVAASTSADSRANDAPIEQNLRETDAGEGPLAEQDVVVVTTEAELRIAAKLALSLLALPTDIRTMILRKVLLFNENRAVSWQIAKISPMTFKEYCSGMLARQTDVDHVLGGQLVGDSRLAGIRTTTNLQRDVHFSPTISVMTVCRELYPEARRVLCKENRFLMLKNFGNFAPDFIAAEGISPVFDLNAEQELAMMHTKCSDAKIEPFVTFDLRINGEPGSHKYGFRVQLIPLSELATSVRAVTRLLLDLAKKEPKWNVKLNVQTSVGLRPTEMYCLNGLSPYDFFRESIIPFLGQWIEHVSWTGHEKKQAEQVLGRAKAITSEISKLREMPEKQRNLWFCQSMAQRLTKLRAADVGTQYSREEIKAALMLFIRQGTDIFRSMPHTSNDSNHHETSLMYRLLAIATWSVGATRRLGVAGDVDESSGVPALRHAAGDDEVALARNQLLYAIASLRIGQHADYDTTWKVLSNIHVAQLCYQLGEDESAHNFLRQAVMITAPPGYQRGGPGWQWANQRILEVIIQTFDGDRRLAIDLFHTQAFEKKPVDFFIYAWYRVSGYDNLEPQIRMRP